MKAIDGPENQINSNNNNNINFTHDTLPSPFEQINNNINKISTQSGSNRKQSTDSENIKKTFLKEFGIKEKKVLKTFDYNKFISMKSCTSYYLGDEPHDQIGYVCSICDQKNKNYICKYCFEFCHKKCRDSSQEITKTLEEKDFPKFLHFTCYCGSHLKHTFDVKNKTDINKCNMMELDNILGISPYHCYDHNATVCCICKVVCHSKCKVELEQNYNPNNYTCLCSSDYHSSFNEFALSFPLENYKKDSNIDVWPVQILNILFNRRKTFNKMTDFFLKFMSTNIDFNSQNNYAIVNQFQNLLELFSDTFNRKFKTYYYDEQMIRTFEYEKLFSLIKHLEVNNEQTTIIIFRLLFILLFIHLRKDFRIIKSLTSNDFMCNSVLQRLIYKKLLTSKTLLTEKINEKYKIREDFSLKEFVLNELNLLMTEGMLYISVEENQDEFEIGLKLICFMLKHLMFNKEDLILLIDSLAVFHEKFMDYIMKRKKNTYLLLDIFNAIVEICYMIAVNYNDLIIEEYLNNNKKELGKFIHARSEHSVKLLSIVLKNCELLEKHFLLLIKPSLDEKTEEERIREKNLKKHLIAMQEKTLSQTTGVKIKMPDNGGLFTDKIVNLCDETLALFCLADNNYQKQLGYIEEEDFVDYFHFSKQIESGDYEENILYDLKLGLEDGYYSLFTSSYIKEENQLRQKLKNQILIACDKIKNKLDNKCQEPNYINLINEVQINERNNKIADIELIRRNILNEISQNINFANNPILLTEEGKEILVNDLIKTQVDESIFKGFFFLTNIHFPNIINYDLVKVFLDFLSLYFLTKRGIMYLLTGKNIQVIQRLINRFRFENANKNININKNRTKDFNISSIKAVLHFLCMLTKLVRILKIKALKKHKSLFKFKKSILGHFENYVYHIENENQMNEYKSQLKEGLEIFNNLYYSYDHSQYEKIKSEILNLFVNNPFHFLEPQNFQRWFDKNNININDVNLMKLRQNELDYYFHFFEIMTKNTFYVYNNDEKGKKYVKTLINFIDLENLSQLLINNPDMITLYQKSILLKFIRTYYLLDYLDPINILKKSSLLTKKQYKSILKNNINNNNSNNIINDNDNINNINNNNINNDNIDTNNNNLLNHRDLYINKLKYIDKLIILINYYIKELNDFPVSIKAESNFQIKKYIKELIFATQEICTKIYYNKDTFNKILPYYYKLILEFIRKKNIFIKMLQDIEIQSSIEISKYNNLLKNLNANREYRTMINRKFDVFNKKELFRYIIKTIYEIFKETKINEEFCLQKYLEIYDVYNEANFPPFSLLEVYDYEYFYQWPENKDEEEEKVSDSSNIFNDVPNDDISKLNKIRESYLEDFRNISKTCFLTTLTIESMNKKIDFGEKYVKMFQAFINSTQTDNPENYRTLLCIMTKILFYNGEHVQDLFIKMVWDKHFFKNLDRELNYLIVLSIYLSQKYELCQRSAEITDITKLTIQFLQLLGEGFNITFHENILKGKVNIESKKRGKTDESKYNRITYDELGDVDKDESSYSDTTIYNENTMIAEPNNELNEKVNKNLIKEIPFAEPNYTIYETAIINLKRIFHLMELNNLLEGEAGFDKLCVLSSNIIDFLIEYIDTLKELTYIIDDNFKNLFFGEEKNDKITNVSNIYKTGIIPIFTMRINENYENDNDENFNKYELRKTMLAYMKIKYFQLLKAYLQLGNKGDFIKLLIAEHLGPLQLYEEILYYMKELINNLVHKDYEKYNHLLNIDNVNSYRDKLNELYMFEDEFRTSVEISVVFQISIIIAIMEETYRITMLKDHFEKETPQESINYLADIQIDNEINNFYNIENETDMINNDLKDELDRSDVFLFDHTNKNLFAKVNNNKNPTQINKIRTPYDNIRQNYRKNKLKIINQEKILNSSPKKVNKLLSSDTNFDSKFSNAVYKFLSSLVSKVEIKLFDKEEEENDDKEEKDMHLNSLTKEITKKIITNKNKDIVLSNINYQNNLDNNIDNDLENDENNKENDEGEEDEENKKYVFFIKPYLSFHLSEQTKIYFLYNVNREDAFKKYEELISYSDYFLFEMMYNMKYINKSNVLKKISKTSFYLLQIINYLLILAENALLMYHYYRDYSLPYNEYYSEYDPDKNKRFIDIVAIIIAKLILIFFSFFVWFYFKFIITFEKNIITKEDKNFIFRQKGQQNQHIAHPIMVKYFREEGNLFDTISLINKDISFFNKLKLALVDSILLNIDINVFVFSFILDIFFLIFGHPIPLAIETLLIYGIFPFLINIFKSFTEKLPSLLSCLIFTYLIIYVYNYITIFYIREAFDLGEVLHYDSETYIQEPFCTSSLQCFLILINYGTRSGGGIGDVLPLISFKYDYNFFIARFFYDMTFFIIIIMIMGNVTFGLIVDTFGFLRDQTYEYENDRKNRCFICQLDRDGCLLKNINFEEHTKNDHNLWNYVNFLIYLHLYNANDFNRTEGIVWDKLLEKDYGWIPMDENAGKDDDDDDD